MSAYNASAPVTASTTAPNSTKACHPCSIVNDAAYHGDRARSTSGCSSTCGTPRAAIVTNQTNMIGPNALPTRSVPNRCAEKSTSNSTIVTGTMKRSSPGAMTITPSTAPSTEMAGVMIPSPYSRAAPNSASQMTRFFLRSSSRMPLLFCSSRASRARMPPSPRLSARRMNPMYFTLTTLISDQTISDSTPTTFAGVGSTPCSPLKHSFRAYSGLVPMSPYTTPSAVSDSRVSCFPVAGSPTW